MRSRCSPRSSSGSRASRSTPKVISITVTDGFHLKNIGATCTDPNLQYHLDPVKPGAEYKLTVTPKSRPVKAVITVTPDIEGKSARPLTAHIRAI